MAERMALTSRFWVAIVKSRPRDYCQPDFGEVEDVWSLLLGGYPLESAATAKHLELNDPKYLVGKE